MPETHNHQESTFLKCWYGRGPSKAIPSNTAHVAASVARYAAVSVSVAAVAAVAVALDQLWIPPLRAQNGPRGSKSHPSCVNLFRDAFREASVEYSPRFQEHCVGRLVFPLVHPHDFIIPPESEPSVFLMVLLWDWLLPLGLPRIFCSSSAMLVKQHIINPL